MAVVVGLLSDRFSGVLELGVFVSDGCSIVNVDFGFIGVVADLLVVFFVVDDVVAPLSFD